MSDKKYFYLGKYLDNMERDELLYYFKDAIEYYSRRIEFLEYAMKFLGDVVKIVSNNKQERNS